MAKFEKGPGQDRRGWDASAGQQVISVGSDSEIFLTGDGVDSLIVTPADLTICTVHERPSAVKVSGRTFVITALRQGDCKVEARSKTSDRRLVTSFEVHATESKHSFKLIFFPGERSINDVRMGTIYVVGANGERFMAAGGNPVGYKDRGGHTAEPTPVGKYILGGQQHVTTGTWPRSAIPYGSRIRILLDDHRIEFETPGKTWLPVMGPHGVVTKYMMAFAQRDGIKRTVEDCDEELKTLLLAKNGWLRTSTWDLNDFGRWAWNMTRGGSITPYYIHTTPETEWDTISGKRVALTNSHGCVHITPKERDRMMSLGYLKKGVEFEVRKYTETMST
jgi:hypothetical protein